MRSWSRSGLGSCDSRVPNRMMRENTDRSNQPQCVVHEDKAAVAIWTTAKEIDFVQAGPRINWRLPMFSLNSVPAYKVKRFDGLLCLLVRSSSPTTLCIDVEDRAARSTRLRTFSYDLRRGEVPESPPEADRRLRTTSD